MKKRNKPPVIRYPNNPLSEMRFHRIPLTWSVFHKTQLKTQDLLVQTRVTYHLANRAIQMTQVETERLCNSRGMIRRAMVMQQAAKVDREIKPDKKGVQVMKVVQVRQKNLLEDNNAKEMSDCLPL